MDTAIVLRTKQGDVTAFTELYNATHDRAYSVAYSILKDEFEAEDIVQEAYIVVMEKLDDLKNPVRFESWFYQIVRTRALNDLKRKRPTAFTGLESISNTKFQFVDSIESQDPSANPETALDEAETRRMVKDMVLSLPEMQKKCILLRYQGDMKVCDIAKALSIPESTVKSNLNYGRKKIEEAVRNMEQKGVKLYSVSPMLVLPLLREVLYMGLGSGETDDSHGSGSLLADVGREGLRLVTRRVIAGICAAFAIGGATVGLNNVHPIPAAVVSEAETHPIPKGISADSLVMLREEGSLPGSIRNTYRLPALALLYGSTAAFDRWVTETLELLSQNLDYYDNYYRDIYGYEGELRFDYVSEIFGNVLVVMATVNDYPISAPQMSICYDLATGEKLTLSKLAEYADIPLEYLESQIVFDLQEHWNYEDAYHGSIENVKMLREKTLASNWEDVTDIMIQASCGGQGTDDPCYSMVSLYVTTCYLVEVGDSYTRAVYQSSGSQYNCRPYLLATDFKVS